MPETNIFTIICDRRFQFTASEKRIADYLLSHRADIQLFSISDLAEACKVADATISRFCRKLGLPGYNAFRLAVATSMLSENTNHDQDFFSTAIDPNDTLKDIAGKILISDTAVLNQTANLIDSEVYRAAVDLLQGAKRVICIGQGGSMITAKEVWHLFSTTFPNYVFQEDSHLQTIILSLAQPGDVLLLFSYSGSTRDIVDLLTQAKANGVKSILVTRFSKSPGARCADIVLKCGSNESPLQIGSTAAKMVQLFVADILFNELCRRDAAQAKHNRERVAEALTNFHL